MRAVMTTIVAVTLLFSLTHRFWLPPLGRYLVVADPLRVADAIVPMAGERSRVVEAARLLDDGYGSWFIVTDMHVDNPNPSVSYTESVKVQAEDEGLARAVMLDAPGTATSTYQEALNLRQIAQERLFRSLIVVTSPYHTRRTQLIMQRLFQGTEISIVVRPVDGHWYRPENWWTSDAGREATVSEYFKLALYLLGYHELLNHRLDWAPDT